MIRKIFVGFLLFIVAGAIINQVGEWNDGQALAKSEVATVEAMSVESAVQSSTDEPTQFVVHDYAVIVCLNGADVTVDKTEPVLIVLCE